MCKHLFFILALLFAIQLSAQEFYIPYRVGDKFGLVDKNGNMVVEPQFDILEIEPAFVDFFNGYNIIGDQVLSSIVYQGKIIVQNQKYTKYDLSEILIRAHNYIINGNQIAERQNLFTPAGVKLFENDLHSVEVIFPKNGKPSQVNEVLIISSDDSKNYTVQVYRKELGKFTKKFLSNIKLETSFPFIRNENEMIFQYSTLTGERKKMIVKDTGTTFEMISNYQQIIEKSEKESIEINEYKERMTQSPQAFSSPNFSLKEKTHSNDNLLKEVYINSQFYLPKKKDSISFKPYTQDKIYVFSQKEKKGIKYKNNTEFIPPMFDEIYKMYSEPNTFIVKIDNLYGIFIPGYYIKPVFSLFPYLDRRDYGQKGFTLIKLFDETGNFICYADQTGKVYYSE